MINKMIDKTINAIFFVIFHTVIFLFDAAKTVEKRHNNFVLHKFYQYHTVFSLARPRNLVIKRAIKRAQS